MGGERTLPWLNETSFEHRSRNGVNFVADRCDFRNGVTAKIPQDLPELLNDKEKLMQDVAEMVGYHATNIWERLNGFQGYDTVTFTIEIERESA